MKQTIIDTFNKKTEKTLQVSIPPTPAPTIYFIPKLQIMSLRRGSKIMYCYKN